jgi:lipid II:glycine glycyltransferase (peptidoglycan interpeptide bridge formation enzyme)
MPQNTFPQMSEKVQNEIDKLSIGNDLKSLRQDANVSDEDFIKFLRNMMTPVKLSTKWVGNERMIDRKHQQQVAETLDADAEAIRTVTKLYDFNHPRWKRIKKVKNDAYNLWTRYSIDYPPEDGIRLIRRELIGTFVTELDKFRAELQEAAVELNTQFDEIISEGKLRRGVAFKREDYPGDLLNSFDIKYSFPSVECASEIRTLNPQLWMQECAQFRENLDEALYKAEAVYLERMSEMIDTLLDKLQPDSDGGKKILRESAVENIAEFIDTFRKTNIGANDKIQELVQKLEAATGTTTAEVLRRSREAAKRVTESLSKLRDEIQQTQMVEEEARIKRIGLRKVRSIAEFESQVVTDKTGTVQAKSAGELHRYDRPAHAATALSHSK